MIRRAGLQRRPAGPAGSDHEANPGIGDGVRLAVRLGRTRRCAAPADVERASGNS